MKTPEIILILLTSALFYAVYLVLFSNQKILRFNRFYLLAITALSLSLPIISFNFSIGSFYPQNLNEGLNQIYTLPELNLNTGAASDASAMPVLLKLYFIVSSLLLLRFLFNLVAIGFQIWKQDKVRTDYTYVLTKKIKTPYSFLNYIFVPKADFLQHKIPAEVLKHEQTHVKQWHTLDILFLESVLVIAWWNPIYWLIRKSLATVHECLADAPVIDQTQSLSTYKMLLLDSLTEPYHNEFASNFNYRLTKKRLIMMTKQISKRKARLLKATGAVALILGTFFALSLRANTSPIETFAVSESLNLQENAPTLSPDPAPTPAPEEKPLAELPVQIPQDTIYNSSEVEQPAEIVNGGINALRAAFSSNFDPSKVNGTGALKSLITFTINTDGSVTDVTAEGMDAAFNGEAIRAIKLSFQTLQWKPAVYRGKFVRSKFRFPITMSFSATDDEATQKFLKEMQENGKTKEDLIKTISEHKSN